MSKYKFQSLLCPDEKVSEEQLSTDRNLLAFERSLAPLNRRNFLGALMAAAAAGTLVSGRTANAQTAAPAITDVLNFALNLEYLEANFYIAVSGAAPLSSSDMGTSPGTVTGTPTLATALDATTKSLMAALAQDERNHIETLRSTISSLGGTPISMPAMNYAAMGAITTQAQVLATARQFTAVGGSAYAGSAQFLVSNTTVLQAAAQILGAEGQHDGALNYQCVRQNVQSPAVDSQDVPPTTSQYFTVAATTALAPQRSTSQVLQIVYAAAGKTGVSSGGFFPNGLNGNIKTS